MFARRNLAQGALFAAREGGRAIFQHIPHLPLREKYSSPVTQQLSELKVYVCVLSPPNQIPSTHLQAERGRLSD